MQGRMLDIVALGRRVRELLSQIATALDSSVARLIGEEAGPRAIVLRRGAQTAIADPAGWERRILSPVLPGIEFELMRTTIGPGVDAGTFPPHRPGSREYLAVESGTLTLTLNGKPHVLGPGDSIYHDGDCAHGYRNDGTVPCSYYLAMAVTGG